MSVRRAAPAPQTGKNPPDPRHYPLNSAGLIVNSPPKPSILPGSDGLFLDSIHATCHAKRFPVQKDTIHTRNPWCLPDLVSLMSVDIRSMITIAGIRSHRLPAIASLVLLLLLSAVAFPRNAAAAPQDPTAAGDVTPVPADCLQQMLNEQKKTRELRDLRNPLPHPDKDTATRQRREYLKLLTDGYNAAADAKTVQDQLSYTLLRATEADFVSSPSNVQQLLKELESDIQRAGSNIGNPANQLAARKKFCTDILAVARPLLANSLDARITGISIIKLLHEVKAVQGGALAKIHPDALTTLIDVLAAADQPDSVKVFAAGALRHVLRNCDLIETEQFRVCDAIATELARRCTQPAYQQTLLEALFDIRRPRRTVGRPEPTVMKTFAAVLDDRSRPIEVRCLAAMGIGRGVFDNQMRFDPLAWKIAQLAADASIAFNRDPGNAKWPSCGASLIFAFRHVTEPESSAATLTDRKGLLNRSGNTPSKTIAEAAPLVKVVGIGLIRNTDRLPIDQLKPLAEWLQTGKPQSLVWDDNLPPLSP